MKIWLPILLGLGSFAVIVKMAAPLRFEVDYESIEIQAPRSFHTEFASLFWSEGQEPFVGEREVIRTFRAPNDQLLSFNVPSSAGALRFDPMSSPGRAKIRSIALVSRLKFISELYTPENKFKGLTPFSNVTDFRVHDGKLEIAATTDAQFLITNFAEKSNSIRFKALILAGLVGLVVALVSMRLLLRRRWKWAEIKNSPRFIYYYTAVWCLIGLVVFTLVYRWNRQSTQEQRGAFTEKLSFVDERGGFLTDGQDGFRVLLDSFVLWRYMPDQAVQGHKIDEHGFRGHYEKDERRPLVVIGGSAAFGLGLDEDKTVPFRLQSLVSSPVINAGVIGYQSGQELGYIVHYLDDYRPTTYVSFTGWNDYLASYDQTDFDHSGSGRWARRQLEEAMRKGCSDCRSPYEEVRIKSADDSPIEPAAALARNFVKANAFVKARGGRLIVVLQPELGSKPNRTEVETKTYDDFLRAFNLEKSFPAGYREFAHKVATQLQASGVEAYDMNSDPAFTSHEALFQDQVHLSAEGASLAAKLISKKLERVGK